MHEDIIQSWGQFETPGLVLTMEIVCALRGDSPLVGSPRGLGFVCLFYYHLTYNFCFLVMEMNKTSWRFSLGVCILGLFEKSKKFVCYLVCELFTLLLKVHKDMEYLYLDEIPLKTFGRCSMDVEILVSNIFQILSLKVKYICTFWIKLVIC